MNHDWSKSALPSTFPVFLSGMSGYVIKFWLMKSTVGLLEDKASGKAFYFQLKRTEALKDKS